MCALWATSQKQTKSIVVFAAFCSQVRGSVRWPSWTKLARGEEECSRRGHHLQPILPTAALPAAEEFTRIGKIRCSINPTMKKQFSFTRAPLGTCGRPNNEMPATSQTAECPRFCPCE